MIDVFEGVSLITKFVSGVDTLCILQPTWHLFLREGMYWLYKLFQNLGIESRYSS